LLTIAAAYSHHRFASLKRFCTFFPYLIRSTASAVSKLAFWEFAMTTRGRFLLFSLAGAVALMIFLNDAAGAADCLAAPNRTPAEGERWYYRTNRETNQKCWHLGARAPMGALPALQGSRAEVEFSAQPKPLSTREQQELFRDFLRWKKSNAMQ
jgi:hypothetical protein